MYVYVPIREKLEQKKTMRIILCVCPLDSVQRLGNYNIKHVHNSRLIKSKIIENCQCNTSISRPKCSESRRIVCFGLIGVTFPHFSQTIRHKESG